MKAKPKKSKISQILHPTRFVKKRVDGTLRIVRDGYSNGKQDWWTISKQVLERDGYQCRATLVDSSGSRRRCPHSRATGHRLEVHHIKELSRGGKTIKSNLITLCESCHIKRHHHLKRQHK